MKKYVLNNKVDIIFEKCRNDLIICENRKDFCKIICFFNNFVYLVQKIWKILSGL